MTVPENKPDTPETKAPGRQDYPIVGIGASAGGLEALKGFFQAMPSDSGLAFVVVTHIGAERKSLLPELLGAVTDMPVIAAEDNTPANPNTVVVARNAPLTMHGGRVMHLTDEGSPEIAHHPIDHFLRSLADDRGTLAVAVVLSGSGSDGKLGAMAVKAAGGMVMAQEPASCGHSSMPEATLETGLVDYCLPPAKLPDALLKYSRSPMMTAPDDQEGILPQRLIHAILTRLKMHTGHDFTNYKISTMSRRIQRRMQVNHIAEPQAYLKYVQDKGRELELLQKELLISVTRFFRDPEAFEALAEKALPELVRRREDNHSIRAWVPGCATGEEAYSIAILLHEALQKAEKPIEVQIFATDLDEGAIETARKGMYSEGIAADVSAERLRKYFSQEDGGYRIHKTIRDTIVFAQQNVLSDAPFTRMDLITCRNLLIYLNADAQGRLLPAFHYALRDGGVLFLGTSESGTGHAEYFEPIDAQHKIMRRKSLPHHVHPSLTMARGKRRRQAAAASPETAEPLGKRLARHVERQLLHRFAPCSVVVDEHDTAVYFHGRTGTYFQPEQGQPRNNVLEMAREGLRAPLASALRACRTERTETVSHRVQVHTNGDATPVDLTVLPMNAPGDFADLVLICLEPSATDAEDPSDRAAKPLEPDERERYEQELRYTRESLQMTIEELQTSNEELQSTNEELQSSNEELETSREEMQSLNEELNTVNAELQSKVDTLTRTNDDMDNLRNNINIFLDKNLRVIRYTRQATDVVRLIESDIGRPLSDLTTSLHDDLNRDCRQVLATLTPVEKEIRDDNGRWRLVRIVPYRTAENLIDGLVITVVDIDRAKQAEADAKSSRARGNFFEGVVQTARSPLLVLDSELKVLMANRAFYDAFDTAPEQAEGSPVYELGLQQWDIPELRALLDEVLPEQHTLTDYRVAAEFPRIGRRTFMLNARRLAQADGAEDRILLSFEDVTDKEST